MKIAVLGANGKTGRRFIDRALAAGLDVVAIIHTHNTLTAHDRLSIASTRNLVTAFRGCDAVVMLVGRVRSSPPTMHAELTQNVIHAMQLSGLSRIISLTGTGVRMPGDKVTIPDRFFTKTVTLLDKYRVSDGRAHAEQIMNSGLDWTLLRVSKLSNTPSLGFRLTDNGPAAVIASRYDVCDALVSILADNTYVHRAPIMSR